MKTLKRMIHERSLIPELARFAVVGCANTAIDFGLFNLLLLLTGIRTGWGLYSLNAMTLGASVGFSYWANGRFTFRASESPRSFIRFLAVSLASLALNAALLAVILHTSRGSGLLALNAAKLAAGLASGAINFAGYRSLVYRPRPSRALPPRRVGMISVVIPAFNEGRRLGRTLDATRRFLDASPWRYEVIVVDDGSTDDTVALTTAKAALWPHLRLVRLARNYGKGRAVRTGIAAAQGDAILYTDADDSVPLDNLPGLIKELEGGAHMAIGIRPDPWRTPEGEGGSRRLLGTLYRGVVRLLLLPGYPDPQCGFKALWRSAAETLLSDAHIDGFAFDAEFLVKARRKEFVVRQVRVAWTPQSGSSVRGLRDLPATVRDLGRLALGGRDPSLPLAVLLAAADVPLRLQHLWTSPAVGGESASMALAYGIFHGSLSPLKALSLGIGPLFGDLEAGVFHLLGPSVFLPRLLVMALSVGTVFLTFLLGRELLGRWTALLAAALLATCEADILATHMAWSSDVAPFFTVLAALSLVLARKRGGWLWPASGFVLGLAAQTDVTVLAALPGFAVAAWWPTGRRRLRDPFLWAAHATFLLSYGDVIARGLGPWLHLQSPYGLVPGIAPYFDRASSLLAVLGRSLLTLPAHASTSLTEPWALFALALLAYGCALLLRRHALLPFGVLLGSTLLLPVFDRNYGFLTGSRFVDDLLPFGMLALALALTDLARQLRKVRVGPERVWQAASAILLAVAVLRPLPILAAQYRAATPDSKASAAALQLVSVLDRTSRGRIVLEPDLAKGRQLPELLASAGLSTVQAQGGGLTPRQGTFVVDFSAYRRFVEVRGIHDVDGRRVDGTYVVVRLPSS